MDPRGARTSAAAYTLVQDALMDLRSTRDKITQALAALPVLDRESVCGKRGGEAAGEVLDEPCPICLVPLSNIFADEEAAKRKEEEKEGEDEEKELLGVTKLVGCGHVFCRRDITEWIRSQHGSCPTCRHTFLHIRPLSSESDDESSDGGEYVPNPEDFEDEDEEAFLDVDGFTDADPDDFPADENMDDGYNAGADWITRTRFYYHRPDEMSSVADEEEEEEAMEVDGFAAPNMDEQEDDDQPLERLYSDERAQATYRHPSTFEDASRTQEEDLFGEAPDIDEVDHYGMLGDADMEYLIEQEARERNGEWGLTDGESESMSSSEAGDSTMEEEAVANALDREVSVSVHEDEDPNTKEGDGISSSANAPNVAVPRQDKTSSHP